MINQLDIRPATVADIQLLYEWRNDESTRKVSRSKDLIAWEDHQKWLEKRLKMESPNLFMCELNGDPVATFRIDNEDVSYTVAPAHRNRGIAKLMLNEVRSRFGCLRAYVYADNLASIKVAEQAGLNVIIIDA